MESPVNGEGGSFVDAWWVKKKKDSCHQQVLLGAANRDSVLFFCFVLFCSRLYVLQGGLAQQEWRVPELLHRLLQYLEPKLTQVYKNVRERIGRWGCFHTFGREHGVNPNKLILNLVCALLQRAHLYLYDWRQLAVHAADHVATHFRLHRANSAAAQASNGGRRGDPEPRVRGEWSGRAGRANTSN